MAHWKDGEKASVAEWREGDEAGKEAGADLEGPWLPRGLPLSRQKDIQIARNLTTLWMYQCSP